MSNGCRGGWDNAHYGNIFILRLSGTRFKGTITMLSQFFLFAEPGTNWYSLYYEKKGLASLTLFHLSNEPSKKIHILKFHPFL